MIYLTCCLQITIGWFLSRSAKNGLKLNYHNVTSATAIFILLNVAYVYQLDISSMGQAVVAVFLLAIISFSWSKFFIYFFGHLVLTPLQYAISPPSGEVEVEYSKARTQELHGNFANAILEYQKYFAEKEHHIPLERIGRCHFKMNDNEKCLHFLEEAKKYLLSQKSKIPSKTKRHEYARLLYLQARISQKFRPQEAKKIYAYIHKEYKDTPFVKINNPQIKNYLEIWANTDVW